MKRILLVLAFITQFAAASPAPPAHITSPEEAFGFKPGADRKLADWVQLTAYFQKLASQSDRVRYADLGKTTEGRPFVAVTISSAENIAHLSEYQEIQRRLADPRITTPAEAKALIARGKTVLVVTCNVHSTEIASSQSATEFAYRLATGSTSEILSILHNTIVVLVPSLNPDGQQLVVDWYKKYLGTQYEGTSPVVIWHHYVGHDDNRDWASFTQIETRLAVEKVINPWRPQILYDLHQMGANGPRIYLPPFVDPIDPNLDPLLISSINELGQNTALEISQTGKQGVLVDGVYDLWSPERNYIVYHNGLRVLTESASVDIATPVDIPFAKLGRGIGYDAKVAAWNFPDPWKGGPWHLSDIVDYQLDAFFSIARNAANNRERYLTNFYQVGLNAVNRKSGPYAYVIPEEQRDSASAARLINTLRIAAIDVQQATADFDADGKHYAKGSYIVLLNQPYGSFAKTLLEIQHYPDLREYPGGPPLRPYDVTAQTLPLLFGVDAVEVQEKFTAAGANVDRVKLAPGHFQESATAPGYLIADTTNSSLYALFSLLKDNVKAYRLTSGADPGTIYIPQQSDIAAKLFALAGKFPIEITPAAAAPQGNALAVTLPRIALYKSWIASMDEGWTRWIFDQNNIPYTSVVDEDIRKGDLNSRFDAIILPDNSPGAITSGRGGFGDDSGVAGPGPTSEPSPGGEPAGAGGRGGRGGRGGAGGRGSVAGTGEAAGAGTAVGGGAAGGRGFAGPKVPPEFTGGLGPDGVAALNSFLQNGGTIVTLNKASGVYAKRGATVTNALDSVNRNDFYVPGSILQVSVDTSNPIAFGSTPTVPVWFESGPSFSVSGDAHAIATYDSDKPLLSGWILGGEHLKGTAAIAELPQGKGRVVLFGIRPQYRAQSEVSYKFLFNSLLYSSSIQESVSASSQNSAQAHASLAANASNSGGKQ